MIPPHSLEAEQAVLGGLLLAPAALAEVGDLLTSEDFHSAQHRGIYAAITALDAKGGKVDMLTVAEQLKSQGEANPLPIVGELARSTPSAANVRAYAQRVRDLSLERQLLGAAHEAVRIVADKGETAAKVDRAQALFAGVGGSSARGPQRLGSYLPQMVDRMDTLAQSEGGIVGLSSGFTDLDALTSGLHPGQLIVIAGRPGMGKTTIAMNMVEHCALVAGRPALVFSMEMSGDELLQRSCASVGRIPFQHIKVPNMMREEDWPRLAEVTGRLNTAPIDVDDEPGQTIAQVRAKARRVKQQRGDLGLVMVDYLQLMEGPGDNANAIISAISRGLKGLAKELGCPVLALSQLNRSVEQRQNKRPVMSDLRESGAIEQDADVILFPYRDEVYQQAGDHDPRRGMAEINIGKQRSGPLGQALVAFEGQYIRFSSCDHESQRRYHSAMNAPNPMRRAGGFE